MIGRRGFITGLVSLVAAPAIVRVGSLMPVRVIVDQSALRQAMLNAAERLISPPCLLDMFDMDAAHADLARIFAVPPHYLRDRQ